MAKAAETHPCGRPTRLTPELADQLIAQLQAGANLGAAARACGLDPRTVRAWRERARSREPRDEPFVTFARRIEAARLAAARQTDPPPRSWEEIAAQLAVEDPTEWEAPPLGQVLADFY